MANLAKIKELLKQKQEKGTGNSKENQFKPQAGSNTIRLLPYKFNKDVPMTSLRIHFGITGKQILSPATFGRPDPIQDFGSKLYNSGDKNAMATAKKLFAKTRHYAYVVVRGEEEKGPKLWAFSPTIYEEILKIMNDDDYGSIEDVNTGTDLVVDYQTPAEVGNDFGKTSIRPKRKSSILTDDEELLKRLLEDQNNIQESYEEKTAEELTQILETYLNSVTDTAEEEVGEVIVDDKKSEKKPEKKKEEAPKASAKSFEDLYNDED